MPSRTESFSGTLSSAQIAAEDAAILLRIAAYAQRRASSSSDAARRIECACEAVAKEMATYSRPDGLMTPAVIDLASKLLESKSVLREWAVSCRRAGVPEHVVCAWLRGAAFHLVHETPKVPEKDPT